MLKQAALRAPAAQLLLRRARTCAFCPEGHSCVLRTCQPHCGVTPVSHTLQQPRRFWQLIPGDSRGSVVAGARVRGRRKGDIAAPQGEVTVVQTQREETAEGEGVPDKAEEARFSSESPFMTLGLDELVTARLSAFGINCPTDVQNKAIPVILSGRDAAVASYTGSGKTLAYMLPAIQLAIRQAEELLGTVDPSERARLGPTAIIVAPSRELAMQILAVARQILPDEARQAVQQVIGGANIKRQDDALRQHQPILVVGTPGRLAEHSRRGTLMIHRTGILILDEADQLLAPNFREDMLRLTQHTGKRLPGGRQTVLVSATLTPGVLKSAAKWCPDPVPIFVQATVPADPVPLEDSHTSGRPAPAGPSSEEGHDGPSWGWGSGASGVFSKEGGSAAAGVSNTDSVPVMPPGLDHRYVIAPFRHKVDVVRRAIHATDAQRVLIFMNFQQRIKDTEAKLATRGMPVAGLHGELTAMQRRNILQGFRAGKFRALIVSDVAARGLDVQDCDAVINLELPSEAAHYAHRAGRTGRAGRSGTVLTIVSGGDQHVVSKLSDRLQIEIQEVELSHGKMMPKNTTAS